LTVTVGRCNGFDRFNIFIDELTVGFLCICWFMIPFLEVTPFKHEFFVLYTSFTILTTHHLFSI
jgi:hypothetical protein